MKIMPILYSGVLALAAAAPAQNTNLGVTLNGTGVRCGAFSCSPATTTVPTGQVAQAVVYSWPGHLYALGIATGPLGCMAFPSVQNEVVLQPPLATLAVGNTSGVTVPGICPQGSATVSIAIPSAIPPGVQFTLQAFGLNQLSARGPVAPAFSHAVRAVTQ